MADSHDSITPKVSGNQVVKPCVFCEKIRELDPHISERVVFFEPLNPITEGHTLIVPIVHVKDVSERPDISAEVMRVAATLAQDYEACNIITSKGADASQTVFHLHVHLVPRRKGDGLLLPWTNQHRVTTATSPDPETNKDVHKNARR
jgi:histidine triad (HIT) family protein